MGWVVLVGIIIILTFGAVVFHGSPYVPSHRRDVEAAFSELYKLSKGDTLVDLGSGDGLVLRIAASRGAQAIGYEINPILVFIAGMLSYNKKNPKTILADMWSTHLPSTITVVYAFFVSRDAAKFTKLLQAESNRLNKSFSVITYGAGLSGVESVKRDGSHFLYKFSPLQSNKN